MATLRLLYSAFIALTILNQAVCAGEIENTPGELDTAFKTFSGDASYKIRRDASLSGRINDYEIRDGDSESVEMDPKTGYFSGTVEYRGNVMGFGIDRLGLWQTDVDGNPTSKVSNPVNELVPLYAFLFRSDLSYFIDRIEKLSSRHGDEQCRGEVCGVFSASLDNGNRIDLWIGDKSHLLRKIALYVPSMSEPKYEMFFSAWKIVDGHNFPGKIEEKSLGTDLIRLCRYSVLTDQSGEVKRPVSKKKWQINNRAGKAIVPFEMRNGKMVITGTLNGIKNVSLGFDTGSGLILEKTVVDTLKIPLNTGRDISAVGNQTKTAGRADIQSIVFGDLEIENREAAIVSTIPGRDSLDKHVENGFIGGDLLRQFVVEVDFDKQQLVFYERGAFKPPVDAEQVQGALVEDGVFLIPLKINQTDAAAVLDTGSSEAIVIGSHFESFDTLCTQLECGKKRELGTGAAGSIDGWIVKIPKLTFGTHEMDNLQADIVTLVKGGVLDLPGIGGVVGLPILSKFNFTIDAKNNVLYLKKR